MSSLSVRQAQILADLAYVDLRLEQTKYYGETLGTIIGKIPASDFHDRGWVKNAILNDSQLAGMRIVDFKDDPSGMQGWAIEDPGTRKIHILFRGSESHGDQTLKDWVGADLGLLTGETEQQRAAARWLERLQKDYGSRFGCPIGHSLGGNLSQYVVLIGKFKFDKCFAFDAPGFAPWWLALQKGDTSIIEAHNSISDIVSILPFLSHPKGREEHLYQYKFKDLIDLSGHVLENMDLENEIKGSGATSARFLRTLISVVTTYMLALLIPALLPILLFNIVATLGAYALMQIVESVKYLLECAKKFEKWFAQVMGDITKGALKLGKEAAKALIAVVSFFVASVSAFIGKLRTWAMSLLEKIGRGWNKFTNSFAGVTGNSLSLSYAAASNSNQTLIKAKIRLQEADSNLKQARSQLNIWNSSIVGASIGSKIPNGISSSLLDGSIAYFQLVGDKFHEADSQAKKKLSKG